MRSHNGLHILRVDSRVQRKQCALDMIDRGLPVAAETATA